MLVEYTIGPRAPGVGFPGLPHLGLEAGKFLFSLLFIGSIAPRPLILM